MIPRTSTVLLGPFGSTSGGLDGAIPFLRSTRPVGLTVVVVVGEGARVGGFLFLLGLFGVTVEEDIDHDVPRSGARGLALEAEDLTAEEPPDEADGVLGLVVGGDDAIDVADGGVGVADGDGRDVGIRSFEEGLAVGVRVSDDDEARLGELLLDLIGEGTGSETTSKGLSTSETGELQDGTLAVRARSNDGNISGLFDGDDHTSGEDDLLVGLLEIDDVNSGGVTLVDVAFHLEISSLAAEVDVASKHLGNILLRGNINVNV